MCEPQRARCLEHHKLGEVATMNSEVIVMIVTLLLPSGQSEVRVTPFQSADKCLHSAKMEANDPLVQSVECSALYDGLLTLQFEEDKTEPSSASLPRVTG